MVKTKISRIEHTLDATDQILGRLATRTAVLLRGKHKPEFEKHLDLGDTVIIENISKIKVTGNKFNDKIYYKGSTRPGGLKKMKMKAIVEKRGWAEIFRRAVYQMLPATRLRREIMKRLIIK